MRTGHAVVRGATRNSEATVGGWCNQAKGATWGRQRKWRNKAPIGGQRPRLEVAIGVNVDLVTVVLLQLMLLFMFLFLLLLITSFLCMLV